MCCVLTLYITHLSFPATILDCKLYRTLIPPFVHTSHLYQEPGAAHCLSYTMGVEGYFVACLEDLNESALGALFMGLLCSLIISPYNRCI